MNRRTLAIVAILAVLALGALAFALRGRRSEPAAQTVAQVSVTPVRYGEFNAKVTAFGRVGAPAGTQAKPAFAVSGILAGIDVRVGQRVQAGTPLAHLDTGGLAISAAQARADAAAASASYGGGAVPGAQIRSAQAKADAARNRLEALAHGNAAAQVKLVADRQNLQREQRLFAAGVAARKDVEAAQAQLAADNADFGSALTQARADYAQALGELQTARAQPQVLSAQAASAQQRAALAGRDYANGTLYAPMDGVVTAIYKHRGESVDSTTPVVALGSAQERTVTLEIAAADARRVALGNPVEVKLADSASRASGRVTGVAPAVDPATQRATVTVNAIPPGSIAGDAVEATIVVARDRGLLVPQTAIVQDPQTGKTVAFVRTKDGTFAQREVRVAQSDGTTAMIASGVRAGENIASQGAFQLLAPSGD